MTSFTKGEIDRARAYLSLREEVLLDVEKQLMELGAEVTGEFPKALETPFKNREVEARVMKAVKATGTALGALTACNRQLFAERESAEAGLFDGQTRPIDDDDQLAEVAKPIATPIRTFLQAARMELDDETAMELLVSDSAITVKGRNEDLTENIEELVKGFISEMREIVGLSHVTVGENHVNIIIPAEFLQDGERFGEDVPDAEGAGHHEVIEELAEAGGG